MKIYLIRHGETTGDVEDRYGGDYDDRLTEKGKEQAKKVAEKLAGRGIETIFSSPRIRAKETADILNKTLACPVECMNYLRERNHYGILTGMRKAEAREKYPEQVELVKDYRNKIEGGEDYSHFKKRIIAGINGISDLGIKIAAIVTHGGPIRCIFREIFGEELSYLGDCAIIELENKKTGLEIISLDNVSLEEE